MAEEIESHRRRHAAEEAESFNDDNVYKGRLDEVRCRGEAMPGDGAASLFHPYINTSRPRASSL